MTREPDPIETQIRGLIGFHCADQAAFVELVAWLDRTVGRRSCCGFYRMPFSHQGYMGR